MILNTHPENRKAMVKAICELTGMNATYLFTPTYAYQVGPITVSRDGSIDCEDEAMLSTIKPMLIERGWLEAETQDEMPTEPESPADSKEVPDTMETIGVEQMDITMPIPGWTVAQMTNLLRMLCSKQVLINRMLGCDMLSIEESFVQAMSENPPESTADFEARVQVAIDAGRIRGFRLCDEQITLSTPFAQDEPTRWTAYADLLKGMLGIAETATRISVKQLDDPENEKYHANSWLMRMGLRGPQYKETRRILMGHLTGFAHSGVSPICRRTRSGWRGRGGRGSRMNRVTPEQPVPVQYDQLLLDLKARQQAGEHMPCPRCGKDTMKPELHTNALSRHEDLYICDKCGTAEAMLDFMNNPLPLSCWAAMREPKPKSDLKTMSSDDAMKLVRREPAFLLIELSQHSFNHGCALLHSLLHASALHPARLRIEAFLAFSSSISSVFSAI